MPSTIVFDTGTLVGTLLNTHGQKMLFLSLCAETVYRFVNAGISWMTATTTEGIIWGCGRKRCAVLPFNLLIK